VVARGVAEKFILGIAEGIRLSGLIRRAKKCWHDTSDVNELTGSEDRERAKNQSVNKRKCSCAGPDGDSQGRNRCETRSSIFDDHAGTKAEISRKGFEPNPPYLPASFGHGARHAPATFGIQKPNHDSAGLITRVIPSNMRSKLEICLSSCLRPADVILNTRILRFLTDNPHSALTQPAFNMRCKAGYNDPSSIWSRSFDAPLMH